MRVSAKVFETLLFVPQSNFFFLYRVTLSHANWISRRISRIVSYFEFRARAPGVSRPNLNFKFTALFQCKTGFIICSAIFFATSSIAPSIPRRILMLFVAKLKNFLQRREYYYIDSFSRARRPRLSINPLSADVISANRPLLWWCLCLMRDAAFSFWDIQRPRIVGFSLSVTKD